MELAEISRKAVELLLERKITVSLAESCTGGMIASALADWPGASEALLEGCVCYTNEAKMRTLGVSAETLGKHTAVSAQCAGEMARGMRAYTGSDYALSGHGNCWAGRRHGRNARGAGLSGHCRQNGRARGKTRLLRRPDAGAPPEPQRARWKC